MRILHLILIACATTLAFASGYAAQPTAARSLKGLRPNIVLIMPDDISYGSIGAYGGRTSPNIDSLYEKGKKKKGVGN